MTKIEYEAGKKIKTMKANIWIRNPQKSIKSMKANSFDHADITNSLSEENVINAESCTSCIPDILGRLKNEEMPKRATVRRSLSANEGSCHAVHSNVLPFNHHAHQKSHERKPVASCLKHTDDRSDIYFDFPNKFDLPKNCKYLVEGQSITSRAQVVVNRDSICEDSASTVDDESPLLRNKCVNRATFDNFAINALDVIDRQAGADSTSESLFDNLSINEELDEPIRISKMSKLTQKKQKQAELKIVIPKNHLFNIKPLSASASRDLEEVLQLASSFSQIGNGNKSMVSAPCTPGGSSSKESLSGSNDSPPGGHTTWFGGLRKKKEQKKTFLDEFNQHGQRNLQSSEVETYKELVDKNVCIEQGAYFSNANVGHHCMPGSRSTRQHSSLSESDRSPSALLDRTINNKKVLKHCVSSHSDGSDGNSCEVTSWHSNSSEIRNPVQRSKSISSEGKVEVIQRRLVKIPQSLSFELGTMTSESNIGMMTTSSRSLPTPTLDLPPPLPEKMGSRSSLFRSDSPPPYPAPTPPQRANTHSPQQSPLQPPELPPPVLKPRMPKRTTEKLKPHPPLARFHSAGEDTSRTKLNHRSDTSRREMPPRLTPVNDNRYPPFRSAGMNCDARLRSSCGSDLVNSSLESMDTAGESADQRNSRLNAHDLGINNKADLFWAKNITLEMLTEAEIQREVFTPIPGRYETSDSVSYEDLSNFSCSQSNVHSQSDQLEQVCDEIRLMMKVFANTVSVNDCETALSETYWNVHDAIKYIKLKCLLEDVSGLADEQQCKQALMFCKWDTHEAASYLQMPPHERYLPNIMGI